MFQDNGYLFASEEHRARNKSKERRQRMRDKRKVRKERRKGYWSQRNNGLFLDREEKLGK